MSTDRADLRTLAAEAIREGKRDGAGAVANAVLAAVLPEHRRMVLTEAADLAESMVKTWPGMGDQAKAGNEHLRQAARRIRRLAAAAPPAGLRASMPAETAPAVPEEADGQRAGEGPYRVGRKVGRTIYRMVGDQPSDTDELIGVMDSPALAAFAVRGMNADTEMESERGRLAQELYEARTRLAIYEHTITWNTTCHNCAAILDSAIRETDRAEQAEADRDRLAAQVAQCQRVIERVRDLADRMEAEAPKPQVGGFIAEEIRAAVDALPDAGPHQHECACNRNWGGPCGPCGPCVCEEPPRQGVWRLVCGAENIPPNQTYATKGAAEDVMRLHDGACPGTHGVEFVPDGERHGADQTENDRRV